MDYGQLPQSEVYVEIGPVSMDLLAKFLAWSMVAVELMAWFEFDSIEEAVDLKLNSIIKKSLITRENYGNFLMLVRSVFEFSIENPQNLVVVAAAVAADVAVKAVFVVVLVLQFDVNSIVETVEIEIVVVELH